MKTLPGHVPRVVAGLNPIGKPDSTSKLYLAIGLPLRNQAGLDELLQQLYDPASTNFHKYLSPAEIASRYGPSEADYEAVRKFAEANSLLVVNTHSSRMVLDVTGRVADVERAFGVTLRTYRHPSEARDFFAPDAEPVVPAALPVADIQGLSDLGRPHPTCHLQSAAPQSQAARPAGGSGPGGTYMGNDFRAAYVPGTSLTGLNQTVGLVQFDGFYSNDITSYESQASLPAVPLQTVLLDGYNGTPGSGNDEVSLDIETVISMAPGISKLILYEGNPNNFIPNDVLSRIQTDNLAKQISSSWTWNGGPNATTDNLLSLMAAQGQSYFNASGDSDAYTGANILDSASNFTTPVASPYTIAVGGTTLSTTGPGGAWTGETVWNWNNSGRPNFGSSGGISSHYTIPNWQTSATTIGNNRSTTMRNVPDVALTADNVYVVYGNGSSGGFGGTSCASPLWAGFIALVNQQAAGAAKPAVGFINPTIYALAAGTNYNTVFLDVTTGNNIGTNTPGLYNAVAGYDLCTGLGTPNGTNFINALVPVVFGPAINTGAWTLLAESATPTNGAIDPGETVTVGLTLQNQGNLATGNLIATLLASTNILAPSSPQTYGALAGFGGAASKPFTFTAAGVCGSTIVATLQLQDGSNSLGTVNFNLPLGVLVNAQSFAENFDAVTVPALPPGWSSVNINGTATSWVTTNSDYDTAPNSVFIPDMASTTSENALVSPTFAITSTNAQLSFRHNFSFNYHSTGNSHNRDGGVLQIQIGNGGFTDITAGGSFVTGGYNGTISTSVNPLGTVSAWVHTSSGWQTVTVNLPQSAAGQNVQLRWDCGTSSSTGSGAVGWNVDSVSIKDTVPSCLSVFTDLSISQSLDPNSLQAGQNLVYTLGVTNLGPQSAANVVVTDTIPANTAFVSAPGGSYSSGQVVFTAATLPVNSTTNFMLTLALVSGNVFTNIAAVATVTPEFATTNNSATLVSTQISATAPVITVSPTAQTIQCGSNAGFTVAAVGATPLIYQWSMDGAVINAANNSSLMLTNVHLPSHTVSVIVTNIYGSATSSVPLTVQDTLAPVITIRGANPIYMQFGAAYVELGATALDLCAGAVPVTISGVVNTNVPGTNAVTYTATDGNGNTNTVTRTVIVRDTTLPTIVWSFTNLLLIANSNCVAMMPNVTGTNFIIATDGPDTLTVTQSPTNNAALPLGTNIVVITVADPYGNKSYSTNRIVVRDTIPPVIALNGFNPMTNELGKPFSDPGATAIDTCSGLALFTTNGPVNISAVGTNVLTYTAVDGSGNTNVATRTVYVRDTTAPTILWSFTNILLAANSNCVAAMPNVTGTNFIQATDLSGVASITQSPTNNAALPLGTNSVVIAVADPYGNTAYSTNQIIVRDQTPPVITLNGLAQMTNQLGVTFVDPGAGAIDACSGVVLFSTNGVVNVNAVGTNLLTYIAVNGSGNTNIATRTVFVVDTTPPAILWSFTNFVLAANSNCAAVMPDVTGTNYILATDLSGVAVISQTPPNNYLLPLGTNVVVIAATDIYSNTAYSTNSIVVQDQTPPRILVQPQSQTNNPGATATFSVAATACTPLAFEWSFNNAILAAQTNNTLLLSNLNVSMAGNYAVIVSASGGSMTSAVAALTVYVPPGISGVIANPNGTIALNLTGLPGDTYILEAATNLEFPAAWFYLATNTLGTNGLWQFTDLQATNFPQQFYRLMLAP